jgi:hypothetical protein
MTFRSFRDKPMPGSYVAVGSDIEDNAHWFDTEAVAEGRHVPIMGWHHELSTGQIPRILAPSFCDGLSGLLDEETAA